MRKLSVAALLILIVGIFAACSGVRDATGQVTQSGAARASQIKVGDCVADLVGDAIENVKLIPCADPHNWEAYASTKLDSRAYPGATTLDEKAGTFCAAQFKTYIGIDAAESKYEATYLYPTADSWQAGDREILCLVGLDEGGVTGSLKNAQA